MKKPALAITLIVTTLVIVLISCSKNGGSSSYSSTAFQDCGKNTFKLGSKVIEQENTGVKDISIVTVDTIIKGKEFLGAYTTGLINSLTAISVDV